jgi:hypothetical protein
VIVLVEKIPPTGNGKFEIKRAWNEGKGLLGIYSTFKMPVNSGKG